MREAAPMRPSERLRFWAHELAAMARTGLEFAVNDYDRDRYERSLAIAEGIAGMTMDAEFTPERPYLSDIGIATPKTGVTVAAFDDAGHVVLIRRADNGRWALPGGWAEVGTSPSRNALRELREETGLEGEVERLVGIYDNMAFGGQQHPYHFFTCLFRMHITGGTLTPSIETPEVVLADPSDLPANMSPMQRAMIADGVAATPSRPAVYQ